MRAIKILDVPPGAAPLAVRRAWVGLVVPLIEGDGGPVTQVTQSVKRPLIQPRNAAHVWWLFLTRQLKRELGYRVFSREAIELLQHHAPEAARWWVDNTPQQLEPQMLFIFDARVCELVEMSSSVARR